MKSAKSRAYYLGRAALLGQRGATWPGRRYLAANFWPCGFSSAPS
ncbi:MAG: hypothetical protein OXU61_07405 [Gammaproteobacteria bacterium]|nr:hypothetical protein [Gammaproteobacteria bacterium]